MTYQLIRGDATSIPLADDSVDLVVTSPPYFALRSYTDGGEHYDGQIGSEATPQAFLEALWAVTAECRRVLKPSGSMFVNLGDKYCGYTGAKAVQGRNVGGGDRAHGTVPAGPVSAPDVWGMPNKSLMGLPWRYAIGCIDQLGLILRAEIIWSKPNGLPESVTDRVRRSHEQWFMFTKEPRYFSAVDEIREAHGRDARPAEIRGDRPVNASRGPDGGIRWRQDGSGADPLGKLPGSVWTIPTEPLRVPDSLGVDHFAAFPSEFPRRLILGWSPWGVCVACGEGRRPVVAKEVVGGVPFSGRDYKRLANRSNGGPERATVGGSTEATITGYACACDNTDAPTRPAVILDPFTGTGTVPAVAHILGRHGIGIDLSADYLRLADWRCNDPGLRAKVLRVEKPPAPIEGQTSLFGDAA